VLFCAPVEVLAQPAQVRDHRSPKPRIIYFTANPSQVRRGEASTLRWKVSGDPEDIYIENSLQKGVKLYLKEKANEREVKPHETATYGLVIRDSRGEEVKREVTVRVIKRISVDLRKKKKGKDDYIYDPAKE
jgi:hypothetical protein